MALMMTRGFGLSLVLLLVVVLAAFAQPSNGGSFQGSISTLRSSNGALFMTIIDSFEVVTIAGVPVFTRVWNDSYIGPTLRLQPGDTLWLTLVNNLNATTNIHFHGMQVSPISPSDNSLFTVAPQTTFQYQVRIPATHPPGLYWYHSHAHGDAELQVIGGMVGAIIVEGILKPFPQLSGIAEDVFVLNNYIADPATVPISGVRLVNGVSQPTLPVNSGETRFWRFGNLGADLYYDLTFPSELTAYVIAVDGQLQNQATRVSHYLLGPSSRVELLVTTPTTTTSLQLTSAHVDTGPTGDDYPSAVLATVVVTTPSTSVLKVDPNTLDFPALLDFRTVPSIRTRTINFNDGDPFGIFLINNKVYDPNRVDISVTLGDIEQWIIENSSTEVHHFHIHQTHFQVLSINGQDVPFTGYQDTVLLPPRNQDGTASTVKVIMPFIDRNIVGKFLFHCHLLFHEDGGMMGVIVVNAASVNAASPLLPSLVSTMVLALAVMLAVLGV